MTLLIAEMIYEGSVQRHEGPGKKYYVVIAAAKPYIRVEHKEKILHTCR